MTKQEKNNIAFEMTRLATFLDVARSHRDKAKNDGNWNDMNYWRGRIQQVKETLDFLNELTNWDLYK